MAVLHKDWASPQPSYRPAPRPDPSAVVKRPGEFNPLDIAWGNVKPQPTMDEILRKQRQVNVLRSAPDKFRPIRRPGSA